MTLLRLPFVKRFRDRHGKWRHYLRRPGRGLVKLPGEPGSAEFLDAYRAGMADEAPPPPELKVAEGSLDALAVAYLASRPFRSLRESTQIAYRRILDRLRASDGQNPVAMLEPRHVKRLVDDRAAQPTAANHLLRMIRHLMAFAVAEKWRPDDPSAGVKRIPYRTKGYAPWSEDDIALYEARWAVGTKQRLALDLLLYTGQRRSDVVRMGRQHIRGDSIFVRQVKTGEELLILMHAALRASIATVPRGQMTFLMTDAGNAFTPNGFYGAFMGWAAMAGVPKGRSPHGLRKAQGRRLAEGGCTAHQIMAVLGHKTLAEAQKYTRDAEQVLLARAAIVKLGRVKGRGKTAPTIVADTGQKGNTGVKPAAARSGKPR